MKKTVLRVTALSLTLLVSGWSWAEIRSRVIEYQDGETMLSGNMYWDDVNQGPRPRFSLRKAWANRKSWPPRS